MTFLQNDRNRPRFDAIRSQWKELLRLYQNNQTNEAITQDNNFGVEIVDFLLDSIIVSKLKPDAIGEELCEFATMFNYLDDEGDENNYLIFDEVNVFNIIISKNPEKTTQKQIETIIKRLEAARKKLA